MANDSAPPSEARYANYFQIGHNAFEFLLDFGQSYAGIAPVSHTRIISGPAYAKELSTMLMKSIGQYEQTFGPIPKPEEMDTKE
jgi:hypothetical protein